MNAFAHGAQGRIVRRSNSRGTALIAVLVYLLIVTSLSAAFFASVHRVLTQTREQKDRSECLYLAESGVEKALAELRVAPASYTGEKDTRLGDGSFTVAVTRGGEPGVYRISATGILGEQGSVIARRHVMADVTFNGPRIKRLHWVEMNR